MFLGESHVGKTSFVSPVADGLLRGESQEQQFLRRRIVNSRFFLSIQIFFFFFLIDSSPRVGLYPDCARLIVQLSNPTVIAFHDLSSYMTTTRRQLTFASFKHVKIFSRGHIVTPCLRIDKQMYLRMTES